MSTCLCGKEIPERQGKGRSRKYCSDACQQQAYRNRKRAKRNRLLQEQRSRLFIVPVSLKDANAFVSHYHRHNKPVPIAKFTIGVVDETGLLRGIAIVNNPIVPQLMDTWTAEVIRVATDGCQNACSALYAASRKIAFAMGYQKLITYTLQEESGASMRGAGWQRVKETKANRGWSHRTGRKDQEVYTKDKWRWETINPAKKHPISIIPSDVMQSTTEHQQLDLFEVS